MAERKGSRIFVWIILALLFVGLIGFGSTGLTGNVRTLGTVGEKPVMLQQYATALREQIGAFEQQMGSPLSFPQAQSIGLDQMVLSQVIATRTLDNEATELGVSVGDARVAEQVLAIPAFQGLDGQFNRESYSFALQNNGQSEAEFETRLREDIARTLLQAAIVSGIPATQAYTDTLVSYIGERRAITWARLTALPDAAPLPTPDEADLQAYYDANPETFTVPEERAFTYVWLTPAMIQDGLTVDPEALQTLYDERIDEFVQVERRLVERLVFNNAENAEAARARIDAEEIDFDGLVAERGLDLSAVDLGDITEAQLGAAGEAVFAANPGDTVGPIETSLGPALFRMNAVLSAEEITFEEAEPELRDELAAERARRVIEDSQDMINDLIVGGATLEDLAERTDLELGTITWNEEASDGIAAYAAFRETAAAATEGGVPTLESLDDGGIFALRLDTVTPPALQPLDDVRDDVIAGWEAAATQAALVAGAEDIASGITAETDFATLDLIPQTEENLTRRGFLEGTPPDFVTQVFAMATGDVRVVDGGDAVLIVRLDGIAEADPVDPGVVAQRESIASAAEEAIARDVFDIYTRAVQERTEVQINDAAIAAVHAQFQ